MASSAIELAAKIEKAGKGLAGGRAGIEAGALKMKRSIEASRDRVTGDGRLSGVKNGKLGVSYTVKGSEKPSALVKATGPWQFIENDTKSAGIVTGKVGRITGKGAKRRRRERDLAIAFGGVGALAGVKPLGWSGVPGGHPWARVKDAPTKGQKPWAKGVDKGTPAATEEVRKAFVNAVRQAF